MKFRSAFAVLSMTVALTACGELPFQKSEEPVAPTHSGPPTVSPLDQPIETGTEGTAIATAEASTGSTAMFRAIGNGWTVTAADKTAVYERTGAKSTGVTVRRMTYGRGVEFVGVMNGQVFSLNVRAQECDTGSGKAPFTASLRVGSQRLTGCAAPTDTMPKAQVTASSAGPKPKATPKAAAPVAKPEAAKAPEAAASKAPAPTPAAPAATTPTPAAPTTGTTSTTPAPDTVATPAPVIPPAEPVSTPEPAATSTPVQTPAAPSTGSATETQPSTPPVVPPASDAPQQ